MYEVVENKVNYSNMIEWWPRDARQYFDHYLHDHIIVKIMIEVFGSHSQMNPQYKLRTGEKLSNSTEEVGWWTSIKWEL